MERGLDAHKQMMAGRLCASLVTTSGAAAFLSAASLSRVLRNRLAPLGMRRKGLG